MYTVGDQIHVVRTAAVGGLAARLPSRAGEPWFDGELCEGLADRRGFDASAALPCWMLDGLGCTDGRLVSRGRSWAPGGTERLISGAHRLTCWTTWDLGMEPSPGDVLVVGDRRRGEQMHSCVFVRSDGAVWTTADVLPDRRTGVLTASLVERSVIGESMRGASGAERRVLGWVDLARAPYDAPAGPGLKRPATRDP